ncbi:hypothetical protein BDE02_10G077100 [Populus trichocarpa]|nr:hypothetical protein BDE02_10G077100 [Populus trichocarpa]
MKSTRCQICWEGAFSASVTFPLVNRNQNCSSILMIPLA